jgi:hypothetical protein
MKSRRDRAVAALIILSCVPLEEARCDGKAFVQFGTALVGLPRVAILALVVEFAGHGVEHRVKNLAEDIEMMGKTLEVLVRLVLVQPSIDPVAARLDRPG